MGHFSIIIFIWGAVGPLLTWIMFKERSAFLKFQAFQALLYQAVGTLVYVIFGGCYMAGMIAMLPILAITDSVQSNALLVVLMVFVILNLCFGGFFTLSLPLFQVIGQWAGLRTLRGQEYRYPIFASLAEKFIQRSLNENPDRM